MFLLFFVLLAAGIGQDIASAIALGLDCADDQVKLIIFKHNSGNMFHQREESVSIRGVTDSTLHTFVQEKPLYAFNENRTTEYCVPKTKDLVYEVVLRDSYDFFTIFDCRKGNGWDDGAYVEVRSGSNFLLFKGHCQSGEEESYKIRCTVCSYCLV